jgi:Flp pilus assembly protein TadG
LTSRSLAGRRRAAPRWWRAARSDRGSSAVELAVLAPALMLICMLILQFGLWFNARQTALAAAQAGATVARQEAASNPGRWRADAAGTARQYYQRLNSTLLKRVDATTATTPPGDVYVTVSGQVAVSVFPFFGLHLAVSATAGGPVECFRPAGRGGAC